jgi:predicted small lipoprotein YifL
MPVKKIGWVLCVAALIFSITLTGCSRKGSSTSTPGTGEEHTLPSAQAGYPNGSATLTPEPGYPH